ncbi:hypothetical protein A3D00_01395 [Candidatus Woesebacteria bacterium RIFCSPHIGHO2_02_FULL_38_9]|uniref:Uncharacterized protein n=1 Tax=Candidatus Woesebacteria bacterium RIFCSPHIGHO2_01_FULL_39_28 TaxID=1802496 RepID=A0A1F7YHH1_9BACT|nr:MAG: hypothetical protein A2627_04010 [Candidatus Woesebacteria bacterium RIFCSPHIGHO2_01_FULL_39_28]OGM34689.1 MAG: hypothetical protein A3D00_01395 [Candidatus Woesebacteria bacterium RIFCSPHIGHO2_02_FULL_38_9]OGM58660.1 MAG: hypothetical protein A3A50_02665 [Candidatus Woesebacteria bacterium RIFCSPLOWO2_01_FULL_38_20]
MPPRFGKIVRIDGIDYREILSDDSRSPTDYLVVDDELNVGPGPDVPFVIPPDVAGYEFRKGKKRKNERI